MKKMKKMSLASQLPEEVLSLIFSQFVIDPWDLFNIERVCQKWRKVCRSNVLLWQNVMFNIEISDEIIWKMSKYFKVLEICEARSGEKGLTGLTIPCLESKSLPKLKRMIELFIPTKNLQDLRIDMYQDSKYTGDHLEEYPMSTRFGSLFWSKIAKCSNLKTLYVEETFYHGIDDEFYQIKDSDPILKSRLEYFCTKYVEFDRVFQNPKMLDVLLKARFIQFEDRKLETFTLDKAMQLLNAAKNTLEECSFIITLKDKQKDKSSKIRKISLPKLIQMRLEFEFQSDSTNTRNVSIEDYSLECPNLRKITLRGNVPLTICKTLFNDSVKSIDLFHESWFIKHQTEPNENCISLLVNCKNLRQLWFTPEDEHQVKELEKVLPFLPIEEFHYKENYINSPAFLDLMKARFANPKAKQIKLLTYISTRSLNQKELDWLGKNSAKFLQIDDDYWPGSGYVNKIYEQGALFYPSLKIPRHIKEYNYDSPFY